MNLRHASNRQLLLMLLLVAALVRLGNVWFIHESPVFLTATSDEAEHFHLASVLASGDWLGRSMGSYHRPQLFAHVCALIFAALGTNFLWVHVLNLVADLASIPAWFGLARRAMPRGAAFIGTLAICLYRPLVHFSGTGYMETFAISLFAWQLYLLVRYAETVISRRNAWLLAGGAGLMAGLGVMCRPTAILLYPVLGMLVWWAAARRAGWFSIRGLGHPALFSAMAMAPLLANALRHWVVVGLWILLGTNSELNWHMSNNRDGWGWEVSSPGVEFDVYTLLPIVDGGVDAGDSAAVRQWWAERNAAYIREEPGRVAAGMLGKALLLLNDREIHCTQNYMYFDDLSPIHRWLPGLGIIGPIGLLGALIAVGGLRRTSWKRRWVTLLMVSWVVVYMIGVAMFLAIARHRLPALVPLLLFAGLGVTEVIRSFQLRRFGMLGGQLAVIAIGVVVTHLPIVPQWVYAHERWWTQVSLGVAEIQLGRPAEAVRELEKAKLWRPDKPETYLQLSVAHARLGDYATAAAERQHVVDRLTELYPRYTAAIAEQLEKVAVYQYMAKDYAAMAETARKLEAMAPGFPMPVALQAMAALRLGEKETARALVARAEEMDATLPLIAEVRRGLEDQP
ncbi:hypothetical protein GC173_06510 [bacterium]|nr:hypothetical protein [bacterium]